MTKKTKPGGRRKSGASVLKRSFRRFPKGVKIEMAPMDRVKAFKPYVLRILMALGHPEALVTDMSSVRDFMDLSEDRRKKVEVYGWKVPQGTLIVDLAQWLKESGY